MILNGENDELRSQVNVPLAPQMSSHRFPIRMKGLNVTKSSEYTDTDHR